ncbi:alpha/beta hydrolase [Gracilimonas sp.]|uniref:alpha/beta hydrolase n=1 Tax=Gracilimonas sp. TaxID=1974203 RepID=UPI00287162B1|nr:dienelactone hydrolase family protein [Gracilimonas sp.]
MNLFRATESTKFEGPHQTTQIVTGGVDTSEADAAMIMIHGRGATAQSILPLANELDTDLKLTLRAPQASGNTWYPNSFMAPSDQNQPGLSSGLQKIFDIVQDLKAEGISEDQIYILGFSQGACLASEFVARHPKKYAGLIALSGGLIGTGTSVPHDEYSGDLENTPIFMGCSDIDPHIPKERVNESADMLKSLNANVNKKLYPGMGHTVTRDEILEINKLLSS